MKNTSLEKKFTVSIKNMVCNRCIMVVQQAFEQLGLHIKSIRLGEVELDEDPANELERIKEILENNGFELLEDKNIKLIEQIKTLIVEEIHHKKIKKPHQNFSDFLAQETGKEYNSLASLFSSTEGITIERYIILQKIEKVKELLFYNEMNLSEIANHLGYSSVAHLSAQFKNVTGMTPTEFRQLKNKNRNAIDKLGSETP